MSAGPRVLLMQLSERTSAKGNAYLSGWLGRASVVAFRGEPDKHGNETWDLFVSTPEPRPEAGQARPERRPQSPDPGVAASARAPANTTARPVERGFGYRGPSAYRRPGNARPGAPAGPQEPFYDDDLSDVGR